MEQNKREKTEITKPGSDHFAMEYLKYEQEKSKAEIRGRNAGIIGLSIGTVALSIAMAIMAVHLANINYKNDQEWRELFGSYDYVSQDGEGQNYYNSGIGGDVNNGAENQK